MAGENEMGPNHAPVRAERWRASGSSAFGVIQYKCPVSHAISTVCAVNMVLGQYLQLLDGTHSKLLSIEDGDILHGSLRAAFWLRRRLL